MTELEKYKRIYEEYADIYQHLENARNKLENLKLEITENIYFSIRVENDIALISEVIRRVLDEVVEAERRTRILGE